MVPSTQENQTKLFKDVIQFSPGKLQAGGGSGLGLYSDYFKRAKRIYVNLHCACTFVSFQRHSGAA